MQSEQANQEIGALPTITAHELAAAYEENTVAADQKFKGKKFRVSGTVASIDTDFTGAPYITLDSGSLVDPQFEFAKSSMEQLAKLKPGAKVTLVCVGAGDVAKIPISNSCSFVNDSSSRDVTPTPQATSPYPMPNLIFAQSDLLGALKRVGVGVNDAEDWWYEQVNLYLNQPNEYWQRCVLVRTGNAIHYGGYSKEEAQAYGESVCKEVVREFHNCLNGKPLNDAALCFKEVSENFTGE